MSFIGRYQAGDFLPLAINTETPAGVAAVPDAAPTAKIYNAAGTLLDTVTLPVCDKARVAGFFQHPFRLDGDYSAGRHFVVYQWTTSSNANTAVDSFDVVPGGDADGAVISIAECIRPEARFLLMQLDGGDFRSGRNPY